MRKALLLILTLAALIAAGAVPALAQEAGQKQEKPKETVTTADPISGAWDGSAVLPDGSMPFFMNLKLEKDKVSGDIGSQEGSTAVTGSWAEGKLSLSFVYVSGESMTLTGAFKEEQLTGEISSSGGMLITFVAKKKA